MCITYIHMISVKNAFFFQLSQEAENGKNTLKKSTAGPKCGSTSCSN